jgi:homoserine O-succinyltransferase/O-acetyltransferase
MPLLMAAGRTHLRWSERNGQESRHETSTVHARTNCLHLGLVNNMPDSALEDTEMQFFELLDAASADLPVVIELFSLPEIARSDRAQTHVASNYSPLTELLDSELDGVIITGTEPRQRNLRDEPYWRSLTRVFDWAETHTTSAILSCLAAHASVLHSDNIDRTPLPDKQFGVFTYEKSLDHPLNSEVAATTRFPHSRWNEIRESSLLESGYHVVDHSSDAGVNLFVKQRQQSLFVHFQGHPEYFSRTLLKEYRRDIRRFLNHERETYPTMPFGYFDDEAVRLLTDFRQTAEHSRREQLIDLFPENALSDTLQNTWHSSAVAVYRNWLKLIASKRSFATLFSTTSQSVNQ